MKKVFWIVGEPSGDLHASIVLEELKNRYADVYNYGVGGPLMKKFGFASLFDFKRFNVMGFVEVIKHLRFFYKTEKKIKQMLTEKKPDLIVLVDYPGFNMRIAKIANDLFIPVIYYICPQFWAWKHNRVYKLEEYVEYVASIHQFEKTLLDMHRLKSKFVGNPITEEIKINIDKDRFAEVFELDSDKKWIGFLPGSRKMEIEKMLPIYLKACENLDSNKYEFLFSKSRSINHQEFMKSLEKSDLDIKVIDGYNYEMMKYSDFLVVTSGTATLEAAYLQTPMIITYKAAKISYAIAKKLVRIKKIGLPNIIAEKEIIPELIQDNANPDNIAKHIKIYMEDESARKEMQTDLEEIIELLSDLKPSKEVADLIQQVLKDSKWN